MSIPPHKKTVLITGCSPGGIGNALAREFHTQGLHVFATARDRIVLAELEELGMTTMSLDVTNEGDVFRVKEEIVRVTGGKLDILVNNAGKNYTVPASEVEMSSVLTTFSVNFFSIVQITQTFIPLLIATSGLILNIGSIAATIPYVFGSIYNASKAALHSYSSTLRLELAPYSVSVMVIVTGGVKSNIARVDRELKPGSLYQEIGDVYKRRVKHSQEVGLEREGYARDVVWEALRDRRKKWVWKGRMAGLVRWVRCWVGEWVFDLVLSRMFGLDRLGRIVRGRKEL